MIFSVDLPITDSRRQMVLMRESFWRLFGDWMAYYALGDIIFIIFYHYFLYGAKMLYFSVELHFYFYKVTFLSKKCKWIS